MIETRAVRFQRRGDIYYTEMNGDLLVYGGTPEVTRISGENTTVCHRLLEFLEEARTREEIDDRLDGSDQGAKERIGEILDALCHVGVVQPLDHRAGISMEERARNHLALNYLTGVLGGDTGHHVLRALLGYRVMILGSELLGSRAFASLLTTGLSNVTIAVSAGAVTATDVNNSPVFGRPMLGRAKREFYEEYVRSHHPHFRGSVIAGERGEIEARLGGVDLVVCARDVPDAAFEGWLNRACIDHDVPWIMCRYFQDEGQVGPTFYPGATACYQCFAQRVGAGMPYYPEFLAMQDALAAAEEIRSGLAPFFDLIAAYLAGEVVRLAQLTKREHRELLERRMEARTFAEYSTAAHRHYAVPETWGHAVTLEMHPFRITKRRVLRVPRCEVCGVHTSHEPQLTPWVMPL